MTEDQNGEWAQQLAHMRETQTKLMEEHGIKCTITFRAKNGSITQISNMGMIETLGALEYAKVVTLSGIHSRQNLDAMTQAFEENPGLIDRMVRAVTSRIGRKPEAKQEAISE